MAVEMEVVYEGGLHCRATHGPSGDVVSTDAPVDNGGKGSAFSPTDLVGASLGSCMMTIMGKVAERDDLDVVGMKVRVTKEMVQQPVRRIGKLTLAFTVPNGSTLDAAARAKLERAALTCPVHQSLHPDVQLDVTFDYVD
ncbi:MAG: OsmC family protein [Planctomycetia bacterium]